jgi:hypothetical protein
VCDRVSEGVVHAHAIAMEEIGGEDFGRNPD